MWSDSPTRLLAVYNGIHGILSPKNHPTRLLNQVQQSLTFQSMILIGFNLSEFLMFPIGKRSVFGVHLKDLVPNLAAVCCCC